jgi:hypothetical protein
MQKEGLVSRSPIVVNRRVFTAAGLTLAAGCFAARLPGVSAHDATPVALTPGGYVSVRLRVLKTSEDRPKVNALVLSDFAPKVQALEGYGGYVLGDVVDQPMQSLSVVAFDHQTQAAGFDVAAKTFVESVAAMVDAAATKSWAGDLLMWGAPNVSAGTPAAAPAEGQGYLAFRVHTSKPGTNPRDFVPAAIDGFLPIVTGIAGFNGYLWFPTDAGFVAISLFDSIESAQASNTAAKDWATRNLAKYTDGNPMIVNANVVFEDLPILRRLEPLAARR